MSKGDWPDDTFTENDVIRCLEARGLQYKNGSRYILTQCPLHEDKNPSAQIYKDDWFVKCHAGCEGGRFHIAKAFPSLRDSQKGWGATGVHTSRPKGVSKTTMTHNYKTYDQFEYWKTLPLIPRDHYFKNLPLEVLDELGWRWVAEQNSYYIPYFNMSQTQIPFSQLRHLTGERRFTFLKDARPIAYGLWNLDNTKLFLVEGASDAAVMQHCSVPWIAMPSAASKTICEGLAGYCKENGIQLVFAGDNDSAGEKLREALDGLIPYRVKQARTPYKDWGEMFEAEGIDSVRNYCFEELFPRQINIEKESKKTPTDLENIQKVFPGATQMEVLF